MLRLIILSVLIAFSVACSTAPVRKPHGLKGGVVEPNYDQINCWVQPPHDDLWYPCQQENIPHYGH